MTDGTAFAVLLPDEPLPVRLMNTVWADRGGVHDALTTTADLRTWLAAVRPEEHARRATPADLAGFRALRDALRRLAALTTGDDRSSAPAVPDLDAAVATVNDAATQAPTVPLLSHQDGQLRRLPSRADTAARRALAAIAIAAIDLFTAEDRPILQACHAPGCVLYFAQDHRHRQWCSTACGNRARAARHYRRHHPNPADPIR